MQIVHVDRDILFNVLEEKLDTVSVHKCHKSMGVQAKVIKENGFGSRTSFH